MGMSRTRRIIVTGAAAVGVLAGGGGREQTRRIASNALQIALHASPG